jgi:beta-mannosidase
MVAGGTGEPFYRDGEQMVGWVEQYDWEYRTRFALPDAALGARHIELVFEGLDTYAEVRLNGVEILRADNMFRRWVVDVTEHVRLRDNQLDVVFRAPVRTAQARLDSLGYPLPVANEPTRVFTRRAAYQYGWDWGPRLVTVGIWRPVRLRAGSGLRIEDVRIVQRSLTNERAELTAFFEIRSDGPQEATVRVGSKDGDFGVVRVQTQLESGLDTVAVDFVIDEPRRWWPNGLGEPHLYDLEAEVRAAGATDRVGRRIGLRTVEVVTEPDSIGESFYLEVNGVPVFMKGANWIPVDHFPSRGTERRYRTLLEAAAEANMNMLRVWGGGVYEDDTFYDLADEYGILIWQDFMFANAMYPADTAFLANVRAEAAQQLRRLRNHPSVALWCGNNEIEEGWRNWGWQRPYNGQQVLAIWAAYEEIFYRLLPEAVASHDSGRFYWPSSPSIGWSQPQSLTRGDAHYWGVWHGREPFEVLRQKLPRFMSEFGFQAYPSLETVETFTLPMDRSVDSDVMQLHQKHTAGLEIIREYMERWYRAPENFESFLYQSQLLQAEGMKIALEAQRRAKPRTMGTLYWQLNDTWPVASWSSIDYHGRWKALHYFAGKAFADVLVSPVVEGDTLEVWLVSDRLELVEGELEIRVLDFTGVERYATRRPAEVDANASRRVLAESLAGVLGEADPSDVVLEARLLDGDQPVGENLLYFVMPKDLHLPEPQVEVEVVERRDGWALVLTSSVLAKNVYLSIPGAEVHFSDNYFDLMPGGTKIVELRSDAPVSGVRERVLIRTLGDGR